MIKFMKDGVYMAVRDENQAAAFINNGWKQVNEKSKTEPQPVAVDEPRAEPTENTTTYTKTDINRLSLTELKELAAQENLADAENKTGSELKKELIEHFGL